MTKFGRSITRNVSFSAGVTRHFAVFSWSLLFTDISALPEQNLIRQSLVSFCLSIELRVLVRPKMGSPSSSLAFLKGGEFFMDSANIVDLYYPNVSQAFTKPVSTASVNIHGFDWTQPFPGKPFDGDGHGVHLAVAQEMMMNESVVQNSSTRAMPVQRVARFSATARIASPRPKIYPNHTLGFMRKHIQRGFALAIADNKKPPWFPKAALNCQNRITSSLRASPCVSLRWRLGQRPSERRARDTASNSRR